MGVIKFLLNKFKNLLGIKVNDEKKLQIINDMNIGDIIEYNNKFCVVCNKNENENITLLVPLNVFDLKNANVVRMSDVNFNEMFWITSFDNCEFIDSFDETKKLAMLKRYRNFIEYLINKDKKQRGSVVSKNNEFFYIYGEEANKWLLFKLYKNIDDYKQNIKISDLDFYSNFDEKLEINKKDDSYKVEMLASSEEIEQIKLMRKSYKKRVESDVKLENRVIDFSTTVYLKKNPSKRYFVLKSYSLRVLVVSYESILNGLFIPEVLNLLEIELDETKLIFDKLNLQILKEMSNKNVCSKPSTVATKKHR